MLKTLVDLTTKNSAMKPSKYEMGRVTENPLASYVKLPGAVETI